MLEIASQIVLCLILAALLGAIIGYLLGKATCKKEDECQSKPDNSHALHIDHPHDTAGESHPAVTPKTVEVQPLLLTAPREGGKDNLQLIKGIGEVIEKTLNAKGIYHFDQIAHWTEEEINWVDTAISFPGRARRENWMEQAKALAAGETTEFSERVEKGEVSSSKQS